MNLLTIGPLGLLVKRQVLGPQPLDTDAIQEVIKASQGNNKPVYGGMRHAPSLLSCEETRALSASSEKLKAMPDQSNKTRYKAFMQAVRSFISGLRMFNIGEMTKNKYSTFRDYFDTRLYKVLGNRAGTVNKIIQENYPGLFKLAPHEALAVLVADNSPGGRIDINLFRDAGKLSKRRIFQQFQKDFPDLVRFLEKKQMISN